MGGGTTITKIETNKKIINLRIFEIFFKIQFPKCKKTVFVKLNYCLESNKGQLRGYETIERKWCNNLCIELKKKQGNSSKFYFWWVTLLNLYLCRSSANLSFVMTWFVYSSPISYHFSEVEKQLLNPLEEIDSTITRQSHPQPVVFFFLYSPISRKKKLIIFVTFVFSFTSTSLQLEAMMFPFSFPVVLPDLI